ncbi:MAG: hypothetical protein WCT51_04495 [Candidatus Shapirobacteria bacterium]|jgi:hypothetical protein
MTKKLPNWITFDFKNLFIERGKTKRTKEFRKKLIGLFKNEEERASKEQNYRRFADENCVGCVSSLTQCDYLGKRDELRENNFEKILDGTAGTCSYRINGTLGFRTDIEKNSKPEKIDLRRVKDKEDYC